MTDVALLGIRVDSRTAEQAAQELDQLAVSAARADAAADGLATTSRRGLAPGMAAGGQQSRMLAMQLSQVAQQASATGNVVQALAIQLPDMTMGFGAMGIAAGILASVALPALVSMMGGTSDEADRLSESIEGFVSASEAYIAAAEAAGISTDELAAKYGRLSNEARAALSAMADIAFVDAMNQADAAIQGVLESLTLVVDVADSAFLGQTESVLRLRDAYDLTHEQASELRAALEALSNAQGLEEQARAAARVQQALNAAYGSAERMPTPLRNAYAAMAQIVVSAGEVNTRADAMARLLQAAANAAGAAASAVDGIGAAAANAYGGVSSLVAKMWELGQAKALAAMPGGLARQGDDGRGGQGDARASAAGFRGDEIRKGFGIGSSGGGGGGGSDPYADNLQSLIESLRSEREIEDEWYQENLAILQDRRAMEILGKQEHDAAMVALHEEYQRRIADIDAEAQQQRLGDTANLFGALASVAQAGGQKMAKIAATFGAIESTINAYKAATAALASPNLTVAGRFAAYASVLGAGLKGVAAIRAAGGIGGGGGGGGQVPAQGVSAGGQTIEYRVYGLERDAVYSGAFIEKIFSGLMEEGKRRGMNNQNVVFVG